MSFFIILFGTILAAGWMGFTFVVGYCVSSKFNNHLLGLPIFLMTVFGLTSLPLAIASLFVR